MTIDEGAHPTAVWAERLFLLALAVYSLVPGRYFPVIQLPWLDVAAIDVGLVAVALAVVALCLPALRIGAALAVPAGAAALVGLWWLASLAAWSTPATARIRLEEAWTLVLAASACVSGLALAASRPPERLAAFAGRLSLLLALIAGVYAAKSLFGAGLGFWSASGMRARGPLYGQSVGHAALVPALALALYPLFSRKPLGCLAQPVAERRNGRRGRVPPARESPGVGLEGRRGEAPAMWWSAAGTLLFGVLALTSRGALLSVGLLVGLLAMRLRLGTRSVLAILAVALAGSLLLVALTGSTPAERLSSGDTPDRTITYQSCARMLEADGAMALRGRGAGSVWSWYAMDIRNLHDPDPHIQLREWWVSTPWGSMTALPLSTPLWFLVELGAVGLLGFAVVMGALAWWWLRVEAMTPAGFLLAGLLASLPAFAFDLLFVHFLHLSCVWWCLAFAGVALASAQRTEAA